MKSEHKRQRALVLAAFGLAWIVVLAMASRPSQEPEILDWWSFRAAAVWTAAACALALLTARIGWLMGPRGTQALEAMFCALRSSPPLCVASAGAPLVVGAAALAWLRIMGVPFDAPLLIGLGSAAGLALIFEVLLARAGRAQHSARA